APEGNLTSQGQVLDQDADPRLAHLARVAALCNDAELGHDEGSWYTEGDPMEGALLALAGRAGFPPDELRRQWSRTDMIPFDAGR
ncbi:hypothetical protein, partial [Priestia megaterium]